MMVREAEISHNPELLQAEDPLREQRAKAKRICENLKSAGAQASFTILGTLHAGIIGKSIQEAIRRSDIVTVELPSISVKGERQEALSKNPFWSQVKDFCESQGKPILGVNNNRSAINARRSLRGGSPEPKSFEGGVDLAISIEGTEPLELAGRFYSELLESDEPPFCDWVGEEFLSSIKKAVAESSPGFPKFLKALSESGSIIRIQVNRNVSDFSRARAIFCPINWVMPRRFLKDYFENLFPQYDSELSYFLAVNLLGHFLRLRVDKTQVDGMLTAVDRVIKRQIKNGGKLSDLKLTHIGGAGHNPNLIAMFGELFPEKGLVTFFEQEDERVGKITPERLTFFGSYVPVIDSLLTTGIFYDQVLFHCLRTQKMAERVTLRSSHELGAYVKRVSLLAKYAEAHGGKMVGVDDFVAEYLLTQIPEGDLDGLCVGKNFPRYLALQILERYPQKQEIAKAALGVLRRQSKNFPKD